MGDALAELLADITEAARTIGTLLPTTRTGASGSRIASSRNRPAPRIDLLPYNRPVV